MIKKGGLSLLLALFCSATVMPRSLWVDKNIYSTVDQLNIGDVLVINIVDVTSMQFDIAVDNKNTFTISSNPDQNITGFLPKIAGNKQIKSDDKTTFATKGKIKFAMATRVMNKAAGNSYAVAGSKTFTVNGISNIITISGLVDPALVKGRQIESNNVADFSIEIKGVKEGIAIIREKVKEGESAQTTLTEDEKQKIIIDYLQKMIGELTK